MPTCRSRDDFPGRKFIFVHVPKTAGTAITSALSSCVEVYENDLALRNSILDRSYDLVGRYQGVLFWHITASDLRAFYGDAEVDRHYSFAFVRNPWDWLVSMYSFIRQHQPHPESMICGHMTFKQFLRYFVAKRVTQHSFFARSGQLAVSEVFRVESMPEALSRISAITGLDLRSLPTENVSVHDAYQQYYDRDDIDLVREAFADDIREGGYTFEPTIHIRYAPDVGRLRRFIVDGTPRGGTTALMGALSLHPACYCGNERFQVFADHEMCLFPERMADATVPPAFPEEPSIIATNVDAYCARRLEDPSEAYPYLGDEGICARLSQRTLRAFGNKTPRYYFNAPDICTKGTIDWLVIVRSPLEVAASWDARMADPADAWSSEDAGSMALIEYLQMCHALTQGPPERTFVVVYEHLFFHRWRQAVERLLSFLGLPCSEQYLLEFHKFFVRTTRRKGRRDPACSAAVAAEFYHASHAATLHAVFVKAGSRPLSELGRRLASAMTAVYSSLDEIVRLYFEACASLSTTHQVLARVLNDQSLYFARARFQSILNPLATRDEWHHLNAWLSIILFHRRAFAAARHFSEAIAASSFSDPVRASFLAVPNRPYIFSQLDGRGLAQVFTEGVRSTSLSSVIAHAHTLELAGLLEDAQILRYRALNLARNEAEQRHANCCFAAGEQKVAARIGIGSGTYGSYLDMDGVRAGFP